jgi:hypothetical protein|tara:strand:- start:608 stop:796 length:189 start_codon:yes stop_codon:yes gene_type:complete
MGFTKRFLNEEFIKKLVNNGTTISKIFNVDALIFEDEISSKIYKLHMEGYGDNEIFKIIYKK